MTFTGISVKIYDIPINYSSFDESLLDMTDIVFPNAVLEAYGGVDSWVPAGRISAVTGWNPVVLYPKGWQNYDDPFLMMGVKIPDGRILDIHGIHDYNEYKKFYKAEDAELVDVLDEKTYFLIVDDLRIQHQVPYPLPKVIRAMFEKYVPGLLYRIKDIERQ